jgi:hypothetical protein
MLQFHEIIQMVLETFANVLKFYYYYLRSASTQCTKGKSNKAYIIKFDWWKTKYTIMHPQIK